MHEWIESQKELPPCDGSYEITNTPHQENDVDWTQKAPICMAYYDGYGFSYGGVHREPKYWRKFEPRTKKYGKLSEPLND